MNAYKRIIGTGGMAVALAAAWIGAAPAASVLDAPHVAFRDLGHASPAMRIPLAVVLEYRHPEQLEQLITLQSDPTSPYYRHWLTSSQFAATFGPTQADYARTLSALERAGFKVTQAYENRTVIDVSGAAGTIERYFRTKLDRVYQPARGVRYTNVRPAFIPPELQGLLFGVSGLNDLAIVHSTYARMSRANRLPIALVPAKSSTPLFGPVSTVTGNAGYGPLVFDRSYDYPGMHTAGGKPYDGMGRSAAIVIDANFLDSDVAAYLNYFNVKRTAQTIRVSVDDGVYLDNHTKTSDSLEATLDVDAIAGNAPGATLYVYEMPSFVLGDFVVADAYNKIVSQNRVDTVNSSFAACETADEPTFATWDHIAEQGAALGITFHASSGDQGGGGCVPAGTAPFVEAPANGPHFVAVGGTSLAITSHGRYEQEVGWGNTAGASGGGVSTTFGMPSWQRGVANMLPGGRNVPDIALDSDPAHGLALYYQGTWNTINDPIGGTSLASPLFGAALAEIDGVVGARTGLVGRTLFEILHEHGYTQNGVQYFHDVTSGFNYTYYCLKGYDNVTGIGSLDFWNIARALKKQG